MFGGVVRLTSNDYCFFFFWYIVSAAATQLRAWSLHMELEKITDEQSSVTHAYQDAHPSYRNKQTHWEV